jgi:hypothetical protein
MDEPMQLLPRLILVSTRRGRDHIHFRQSAWCDCSGLGWDIFAGHSTGHTMRAGLELINLFENHLFSVAMLFHETCLHSVG